MRRRRQGRRFSQYYRTQRPASLAPPAGSIVGQRGGLRGGILALIHPGFNPGEIGAGVLGNWEIRMHVPPCFAAACDDICYCSMRFSWVSSSGASPPHYDRSVG